jgi:hypothetical protein
MYILYLVYDESIVCTVGTSAAESSSFVWPIEAIDIVEDGVPLGVAVSGSASVLLTSK